MDIMHSEWKVRIENWLEVLKKDLYRPIGEITWEARRTKEYLTPEEAQNGSFEPVKPGYSWGETWEYCWFRGSVEIPEGALVNEIKCRNPRCITTTEQELTQVFRPTDKADTYRCLYCESKELKA